MSKWFFLFLVIAVSAPANVLAATQCEGPPAALSVGKAAYAEQVIARALACAKRGKTLLSISLLSELVGRQPNNANAYLNRGNLYASLRDFDAAVSDYTRVIQLKPRHFGGWYNRGASRLAGGQYDEAIADLTKAIQVKPGLANGYCNRGLGYLRKGENEPALADFEMGLALGTDLPLCYVGRGDIHLRNRNYRDAVDDLSQAITLKPNAEALVRRAVAYEKLNETDKAIRDYREALSLNPKSTEAQSGLARLTQNDLN